LDVLVISLPVTLGLSGLLAFFLIAKKSWYGNFIMVSPRKKRDIHWMNVILAASMLFAVIFMTAHECIYGPIRPG
jgi:hypothetical protein